MSGFTAASDFPVTALGYDPSYDDRTDAFVSRLDMGVPLWADVHEVSMKSGGRQRLTINAGKAHAGLRYWIFGSETGARPGLVLQGVHIPLNPSLYTVLAMGAANSKELQGFRGVLDVEGRAQASINLPPVTLIPSTFHHAYVVYDSKGRIHMASNAVPVSLR